MRDVVSGRERRETVEEPEPLLSERERRRLIARHGHERQLDRSSGFAARDIDTGRQIAQPRRLEQIA